MTDDRLQLEVDAKYWRKIEDRLQYGLLIALFITMGILDHLPHHTAKVAVLYFVAFLMCMMAVTSIVSIKAHKLTMKCMDSDISKIKDIVNGRIE